MYLAGGAVGTRLKDLLVEAYILQHIIPIQGRTRKNLAVNDTVNNKQYRFGMPGPVVAQHEWKNTLKIWTPFYWMGIFWWRAEAFAPECPLTSLQG